MKGFVLKKEQRGVMLLEALIALVIFSIGMIALMGLLAAAISHSGDAKYRADASFLANQIIGQIWSDRENALAYDYDGNAATSCSATSPTVCNWLANVRQTLPGAAGETQRIQITNVAPDVNEITVTVRWRASQDQVTRRFVTSTQVGG
ncbi:MAG TPA: hypothetical protein VM532_14840 [Burkholderiales bacterium]|nr:hypothetical protein [Burkholderiales bacterium]